MRISLLLMFLLTSCTPTKEYLIRATAPYVIQIPGGSGSLVKHKNKTVALSAAHICAEFPLLVPYTSPTRIAVLPVLKVDKINDLCAIEAPQVPGLALAERIELYQEIMILGYPYVYSMRPSFGFLVRVNKIDAETTAQAYPGNSGSPAVDLSGRLVGVVVTTSRPIMQGNLVPLEVVRSFLESL